jgi:integrase
MATIRKRGRRWQVQVRRLGHRPLAKSFASRAEAEAWARKTESSIDRGDAVPVTVTARKNKGLTLRELLTRYRNTFVAHKRSRAQEESAVDVFLREPICDLPAASITPLMISDYRDRRLTVVKPSSVARTLSIVQHAFEVAQREWGVLIAHNPVGKVKRPKLDNQRIRRLSADERTALFRSLAKSRNRHLGAAIEFALETGMRRSELLGLRWVDVDLNQGVAGIRRSKNGRPRTIPLTPRAVELLTSMEQSGDRILPMTPNALRLAWVRLCRRAKIQDLHFHDLRHEAISRFFELGLSLPEVALISGHADPRMLMRYTHIQTKSVRDMILRLKLAKRVHSPIAAPAMVSPAMRPSRQSRMRCPRWRRTNCGGCLL